MVRQSSGLTLWDVGRTRCPLRVFGSHSTGAFRGSIRATSAALLKLQLG